MSKEQVFIAGSKFYPNAKSYRMSSALPSVGVLNGPKDQRTHGGQLVKAVLYSVKRESNQVFDFASPTSAIKTPTGARSEIDTTLKKQFQFNPPDLQMSVQMAPTDPYESTNAAASSGSYHAQIGIASTGVEMLFDRTLECADPSSNNPYARLGVAKDIFDIYGVIAGNADFFDVGDEELTITNWTRSLSDLVTGGSEAVMGGLVAIQYSADFVIFGLVTGLSFRFVKFNHRLVPIMGYVSMQVDIHNVNNSTTVSNQFIPANAAASETADDVAAANGLDTVINRISDAFGGGYGATRGSSTPR
jgi:hypothetical protein